MAPAEDLERLDGLWRAHSGRVHAYAARQVGINRAEDVVAETFVVAWRRLADVPDAALPWLLVTARHIALSTHRRYRREVTSLHRLTQVTASAPASGVDDAAEREHALTALASLREADREALLLTAWDGLSTSEAATVTGCSEATFRVRLHRARARLGQIVDAMDDTGRTLEPDHGRRGPS